MDHPKFTHLSLCSGYGGIDLGLRSCIPNLRTIAYSEVEAFAIELLLARMESGSLDAAPIWPDVKSFPWSDLRDRVDIVTGGYPCQPFSSAGKRLGRDDPRHLWPYIADGVSILRPRFCFWENVEGHISLGLQEVIGDLESLGYKAAWGIFSAAEVGAPHQRKRVFILAHRNDSGLGEGALPSELWANLAQQSSGDSGSTHASATEKVSEVGLAHGNQQGLEGHRGYVQVDGTQRRQIPNGCSWPSRPGSPQFRWEPPRVVGDAQHAGSQGQWHNATSEHRADSGLQFGAANGNDFDTRQTEPSLGRDADGPSGGMGYAELCVSRDNRTDELRLLGNGVVPATAARAFRVLLTDLFQ